MSWIASGWIGTMGLAFIAGCSSTGSNAAKSNDAGTTTPLVHIDRSHLADVGTANPLDYSDPNLWVCRPGIDPNPCYGAHGELDATELLPDGTTQLVRHQRADKPKFDCFYVYPTVYLSGSGNETNLSDITYVLDALMAQGARMSELCEVYAPLYRQVVITPTTASTTLADASSTASNADAGGAGLLSGPAASIALGDVRGAFQYYLDHFNNGRKFVLMGHSQGSGMLIGMMQKDVDPVSDVRARMMSALLIGGGATIAQSQDVNGTFKNIPTCNAPGDTGCMVAYSSFDSANPPGANALFGRAPSGFEVACTDPATLAGNSGPFAESYFPTHIANPLLAATNPHMPDPGTAFLLYKGVFTGKCTYDGVFSYLSVTLDEPANDPRGVPPYHTAAEALGFGLHVVDWAMPMRDLIETVSKQATASGL